MYSAELSYLISVASIDRTTIRKISVPTLILYEIHHISI